MIQPTEMWIEEALAGKGFGRNYPEPLSLELAFTQTFQQCDPADTAAREVACLRVMFPAMLQPIQSGDLIAGRIRYPLIGFSPEPMGLGFYCRADFIRQIADSGHLPANRRAQVDAMLDFWSGQTTASRARQSFAPDIQRILPSDAWTTDEQIAFPLYRLAGSVLDFGKLLTLGLGGLKSEIRQRLAEPANDSARSYLRATADALDLIADCCSYCAADAREQLAANPADAARLLAIAQSLDNIAEQPPQSFRQAVQLMWLYALVSGAWNYGRMDTYLAPFLDRDLRSGAITETQAQSILESLWRLIKAYENQYNNRVFIGGRGRGTSEQQAACDRFAILAIRATRATRLNQPQLSLRFHQDMNPAVYQEALDAIGEGCTFPILYNDDVNITAVSEAFNVSTSEAEQYTPYGCGEYVLAHKSIATPNAIINLAKCVEAVLQTSNDFSDFESFWRAYADQVERHVRACAQVQSEIYQAAADDAPFLLISALYDDCIARGRPLLSGGVRYLGGTLETYGNTNAADSLHAINELVFRQKRFALDQIRAALRADFVGQEQIRAALRAVAKYGNDDDTADAMAARVHEHVCRYTRDQAAAVGLHHYLVVIINNWANVILGRTTGATADGRRAGEPLANGNNPSAGNDISGVTAFLNSLTKLTPAIHAGAVQNMKFSPEIFRRHREKLESLLAGYFNSGGAQAMITVVSADDLRHALTEPEKWGHLMVRVGGFSARFIDLPREVQLEIIARTLNQ